MEALHLKRAVTCQRKEQRNKKHHHSNDIKHLTDDYRKTGALYGYVRVRQKRD